MHKLNKWSVKGIVLVLILGKLCSLHILYLMLCVLLQEFSPELSKIA